MDLKKTIEDNIKKAIKEFEEREDIVTKFGEPVIGYANAADPLFNMFFSKNISEHPKGIYRQGNSLIMHFVPYAEEVTKNNANSDEPSAEWVRAYVESIWLSMKINGAIRDILDQEGIASSYLNTPADWNEETHREKWSHKLAACVAGMGELGPAGSFHTKDGTFGGRVSGMITDEILEDDFLTRDTEQAEKIYQELMAQYCYEDTENVSCSEEMIKACPGNAISENGIDKVKCQEYCKTLHEYIPAPDVCGKCFSFK